MSRPAVREDQRLGTNKQIAGDMGISETTVKIHRRDMMRKIDAASLPDLWRMADKLKLLPKKAERL